VLLHGKQINSRVKKGEMPFMEKESSRRGGGGDERVTDVQKGGWGKTMIIA
jgi:hypothetical protein